MWRNLNFSCLSELDLPTRLRLRTPLWVASDYALNVLLLLAFALAGTIGFGVPLAILILSVLLNAIILIAIASGATLRMNDPSITGVQVTAACGVNLLGLILAPQIAYMFIVNLFLPLSFGSLHFTRRGFLAAWCLLTLGLTGIMTMLGDRIDVAMSNPAEQWLCYVVLTLAFGRFLGFNAEVSRLRARLHNKNKELARAAMQLAELATHDELTGVWNRRQFIRLLQDELNRTRRSGSGFCVGIADADHFSAINETFGVRIGDTVLEELARVLEATLRSSDRIGRYGGEQFAMMLVDTRPDAFIGMMERVRIAVEAHNWDAVCPGLKVTVSIGLTRWQNDDTHARILNRADAALCRAKNVGRNRIEEMTY
jgi:diguanylate cyclase (GGDEF)-like protein